MEHKLPDLSYAKKPTSGTATVAGFDVAKSPADMRKSIGYVS